MKSCNMVIQIRLAFEYFIAILAWEGFEFSQVFGIDVILQGLTLRKSLIANITFVRFVACMNRLVSFEVHIGFEGFNTMLALIGSFSGMCKHMPTQFGLFHANVITKLTFVFFHSSVDVPKKWIII